MALCVQQAWFQLHEFHRQAGRQIHNTRRRNGYLRAMEHELNGFMTLISRPVPEGYVIATIELLKGRRFHSWLNVLGDCGRNNLLNEIQMVPTAARSVE